MYLTYNRLNFTYSIGKKEVSPKQFWFHVKYLIINKKGSLIQDDKNILMYEA